MAAASRVGVDMGTVIRFPDERIAGGERGGAGGAGATIVILPVIRIERGNDEPSGGIAPGTGAPGRKRRRRGSR
jgi:hypothetical protein